jgi:hypothetical protein
MYGQQSSFQRQFDDNNKQSAAPKGLAALFGVIFCYQVVTHIFLHQAISHDDAELESDGECSFLPGASGQSSDCMEAQLFHGWHGKSAELPAESSAELNSLLAESPSSTSAAPQAPSVAQGLRGDEAAGASAIGEAKPEALEGLLWDMVWKMGGGDQSHAPPEKNKKPTPPKPNAFMAKKSAPKPKKTSFAMGLTELQQKLEEKMQKQARRHAEHRAMRALTAATRSPDPKIGDVRMTVHHAHEESIADDNVTAWAHNLDDLTHELQSQMSSWRKERAEHAAAHRAATEPAQAKDDPMTPWAHKLDDATHELQEHLEHRAQERALHAAQHEAAHAARLAELRAATHPTPHSQLLDDVESLGRQMCQDPSRRNRPACAQFLHPDHGEAHQTAEERHESALAHIKLLEKHMEELSEDREHDDEEIRKESNDFLRELCADPARHSYPTCAHLLATTTEPASGNLRSRPAKAATAVAKEAFPAAASYPNVLSWQAVMDAEAAPHGPQHMGAGALVMSRSELRVSHWNGKIPKVACVTVLPAGQVTEVLMRYFMDNYKLLHYEGERVLVFVYSDTDKEAARIAHLYTDGTSIKAAAAQDAGGFPSPMAYRYGAWQAHDADLVVRWDFEAWHHPNRLSMQVRAITLAKRPASIVPKVTGFDVDGKSATVAGGGGSHGSMMGEAAWMRKHWMPGLEKESSMLNGLHSKDVVQVAMPDLLAYHDVTMLS